MYFIFDGEYNYHYYPLLSMSEFSLLQVREWLSKYKRQVRAALKKNRMFAQNNCKVIPEDKWNENLQF